MARYARGPLVDLAEMERHLDCARAMLGYCRAAGASEGSLPDNEQLDTIGLAGLKGLASRYADDPRVGGGARQALRHLEQAAALSAVGA